MHGAVISAYPAEFAGINARDLCKLDAATLKRHGESDPVRVRLSIQEHDRQRKRLVDSILAAYERTVLERVSEAHQRQRASALFSVSSLPSIVEELPPSIVQLAPGMFNSSKALTYQRKHALQQAVINPMLQELAQLEVQFSQELKLQQQQRHASEAEAVRNAAAISAKEFAHTVACRKSALAAQRQRNAESAKERMRSTQAERSAAAAAAQSARLEAAAAAAKAVQEAKSAAAAETQLLHEQRAQKRRKQEARLARRLRKRQRRAKAKAAQLAAEQHTARQKQEAEQLALNKQLRQEERELARRRAGQSAQTKLRAAEAAAAATEQRIQQLALQREHTAQQALLRRNSTALTARLETVRAQRNAEQEAAAQRAATRLALSEMIAERHKHKLEAESTRLRITAELREKQRRNAVRRAKRKQAARRTQREQALKAKQHRMEQLALQRAQSAQLMRTARHEAEMTRAALRAEIEAAGKLSPHEALLKIEVAKAQMARDLDQKSAILVQQGSGGDFASSQLSQDFSSILSVSSLPRGHSAVEQLRNLQADMNKKYDAMAAAVGRSTGLPVESHAGSVASQGTDELLEDASQVGLRAGVSWALASLSTTELLNAPSRLDNSGWSAPQPAVPAGEVKQRAVSAVQLGRDTPQLPDKPISPTSITCSRLNMQHPLLQPTTWLKSPVGSPAQPSSARSAGATNGSEQAAPRAPPKQEQAASTHELIGYFDDSGHWHLYDDVGFHDSDGVWQFYEGYYDNTGAWHLYADEGYYDSEGGWHEHDIDSAAASTLREDGVDGLPGTPPSAQTSLDSMASAQCSPVPAEREFEAAMQEALQIRERVLNTRSTLTSNESDWEEQSRQSTELGRHQQQQLLSEGSLGAESLAFAQAYSMSAYRAEPNG